MGKTGGGAAVGLGILDGRSSWPRWAVRFVDDAEFLEVNRHPLGSADWAAAM